MNIEEAECMGRYIYYTRPCERLAGCGSGSGVRVGKSVALVAGLSAGTGNQLWQLSGRAPGGLSRRSLSTREILMGPEQELKFLFRDSNMNAVDIDEEERKGAKPLSEWGDSNLRP